MKAILISLLCTAIIYAQDKHASFLGGEESISRVKKSAVSIYVKHAGYMETEKGYQKKGKGTGSGVIINTNGLIVTAYHVVADPEKIYVTLYNGKELEAKLVGFDALIDIALLQIQPSENDMLCALEFGDSGSVDIGEQVIAVGNPVGYTFTFTSGIISHRERVGIGLNPVEHYLQFDAVVHPGNSGGPVLNKKAQIIGIISANVPKYAGLGFAVPTVMVTNTIQYLLKGEKTAYPYIGVFVEEINRMFRDVLDVDTRTNQGLFITAIARAIKVKPYTPQFSDIIIAADGQKTANYTDLADILKRKRVGDKILLTLFTADGITNTKCLITEQPYPAVVDYVNFFRLFLFTEIQTTQNQNGGISFTISNIYANASVKKSIQYGIGATITAYYPKYPRGVKERLIDEEQFNYLVANSFQNDNKIVAFAVDFTQGTSNQVSTMKYANSALRVSY